MHDELKRSGATTDWHSYGVDVTFDPEEIEKKIGCAKIVILILSLDSLLASAAAFIVKCC